jgi:Calpain family cysteine protease
MGDDHGDKSPDNLSIGAINPFALTEALLGRKVDWSLTESANLVSETLQTDYDELFDMKFNSPIFAGLKLNSSNMAEPVSKKEMKLMTDKDRQTPSLATVKRVSDLENLGIKDINSTDVKRAWTINGKLNLVLNAAALNKKLSNTTVSQPIMDISTPFRPSAAVGWTPPGYTWRDMGDFFKDMAEFDDPIQGAVGNCYLIAAIAAVAWADPYTIAHHTRPTGPGDTDRVNTIEWFTKGGSKDAPTARVEVTDKVIVNASTLRQPYCSSHDLNELWPSLYEKSFAKWILKDPGDTPDITQTAGGDPAKCTAQINGKTPYYFATASRTADQLYTIVRSHSMSYKTFAPMTAWTYASGPQYTGSNIIANHAYTVLGWAWQNSKQYIVLRNPWGVTEPHGLNTYQGLLSFFDGSLWHPINTIPNDGIFALEASAFKYYYACLGVAK